MQPASQTVTASAYRAIFALLLRKAIIIAFNFLMLQ